MDFNEVIEKRFSVRKFQEKDVEMEKIEKILETAKLAPTAVNYQPQKILVLTEKEKLQLLKNCTRYDFDAPLAFIVCYDKDLCWKRRYDEKTSGDVDASIITTYMMLQIQNLGLGTTWVMSFNPFKLRENYNIPENFEIVSILPVGYPASDAPVNPLHYKNRENEEMNFFNSFEG